MDSNNRLMDPLMLWPDFCNNACPLCGSEKKHDQFFKDKFRPYYRCSRCDLIFVPPHWQLTQQQEKARYDTHQNDPADRGYRKYLGRIIPPLEEFSPGRKGLDFGCGPGPALAMMLEEKGYQMNTYDPYYGDDKTVLSADSYDFITSTEVFEHLVQPDRVISELLKMLKPTGLLAIMTQLVRDTTDFSHWYYKDDETHICYFSRKTFSFLGDLFNLRVKFYDKDIIILSH